MIKVCCTLLIVTGIRDTYILFWCLLRCLPPYVGLPRYWLSAPKVTFTVDSLQVCLRGFQLSAEPLDFLGWALGVLLPAWLDQFSALVDWYAHIATRQLAGEKEIFLQPVAAPP